MSDDATIQGRWDAFVEANPHALTRLEQLAAAWIAAGRRRISTKTLWEVLRYETGLRTTGDVYKLNNTLTSRAARYLLDVHPEWEPYIETRTLRAK